MWLGILIIAGLVLAVFGGLAGLGIYAVPVAIVLVGGVAWLVSRRAIEMSAGTKSADDVNKGRVKEFAHPGQEHMVPDQEPAPTDHARAAN